MEWIPITIEEINKKILITESELKEELLIFWQRIKIEPTKWIEEGYGNEGGGFWVVAICGGKVIWYNDIEEGFNISPYKTFGQIEEYSCEQDELIWAVGKLFNYYKT